MLEIALSKQQMPRHSKTQQQFSSIKQTENSGSIPVRGNVNSTVWYCSPKQGKYHLINVNNITDG